MGEAEDKKKKSEVKKGEEKKDEELNEKAKPLDDQDINLLKRYGMGPYSAPIKKLEEENKEMVLKINKLSGIKESDTGLALPSQWDLASDKQLMSEQPLQVARCTKIINPRTENAKYMITIKQIAKFVVGKFCIIVLIFFLKFIIFFKKLFV